MYSMQSLPVPLSVLLSESGKCSSWRRVDQILPKVEPSMQSLKSASMTPSMRSLIKCTVSEEDRYVTCVRVSSEQQWITSLCVLETNNHLLHLISARTHS